MNNTQIEKKRTHDTISYDVLFKENSRLIFKLIYNFVKAKNISINRSEIDDIYQEIALKIFKNDYLSKFNEEKSSFITWLNIICKTTAIDYYRKKMRCLEDVLTDATPLCSEEGPDLTSFSLPTDVLTARQTEVLTLLFKEGLVSGEIAGKLGISIHTVRSLKYQALERLRAHYETTAIEFKHDDAAELRRKAS